jgi:endonuclease/exonuclease/phosphatase family metal-dependent hydrolase
MRLVVATYNVHAFVGTDRRFAPERVGEVLREIGADVVGLQEVQDAGGAPHALDALAEACGAHVMRGPTFDRAHGSDAAGAYGNAILSRLPFGAVERIDLSLPGREPRGAIDAAVEPGGGAERVRVLATHLGVGARERRRQVRTLLAHLGLGPPGVRILLGDMNEWVRGAGALAALHRVLGRAPGPRTYPSALPVFSLDRIWIHPRSRARRLWVHRSRLARVASDHLPVVAELHLEPSAAAAPPPEPDGGTAPARNLL